MARGTSRTRGKRKSEAKPAAGNAARARRARTAALDEPVPLDEEGLKRARDIIVNARATWFALLGALVFASVTLAGVKDIAFFTDTVETKLPLVGFSVPVRSFFWAGALLIAALYAYFHLYLDLLWQVLGDAPARDDKHRLLADRVEPWIVVDSALRLRDRLRKADKPQRASRPRAMERVADIVSFSLVWVFGLAVVFWFWWRSMPAHEPLLTGWLGLVFGVTVWAFLSSLTSAQAHLRNVARSSWWGGLVVVSALAIAGLSVVRTWIDPWTGKPRETILSIFSCDEEETDRNVCWDRFEIRIDFLRPARADLREVVFTEKPKDWVGLEIGETEFRARWCDKRVAEDGGQKRNCANPLALANRKFAEAPEEKAFQEAWEERRTAMLAAFPKPDLRRKDLRGANLRSARLEGADLRFARLEGADLDNANFEGASLNSADFEGASLSNANLEGADLTFASLDGADLTFASLDGTKLWNASLEGANLTLARLRGVDFGGAHLEGADLRYASLLGTVEKPLDLTFSHLKDADLTGASLRSAIFATSGLSVLSDLIESKHFQSSFGDASVKLPDGVEPPCQWGDGSAKPLAEQQPLSDEQFFGRWRGWLERGGTFMQDLYKFPAIPPHPGCEWPTEAAEE
jgi:uncharacterized protein YjbI with pentapeptide repeats